ncbi:unnamed protein product, partial [Phaeothamnion confervicola]
MSLRVPRFGGSGGIGHGWTRQDVVQDLCTWFCGLSPLERQQALAVEDSNWIRTYMVLYRKEHKGRRRKHGVTPYEKDEIARIYEKFVRNEANRRQAGLVPSAPAYIPSSQLLGASAAAEPSRSYSEPRIRLAEADAARAGGVSGAAVHGGEAAAAVAMTAAAAVGGSSADATPSGAQSDGGGASAAGASAPSATLASGAADASARDPLPSGAPAPATATLGMKGDSSARDPLPPGAPAPATAALGMKGDSSARDHPPAPAAAMDTAAAGVAASAAAALQAASEPA